MEPPSETEKARLGRQRVLALLEQEADLPALGASVAKVVELSSSENQDIQQLAEFILSDVALTQRILRVANSPKFRSTAGPCTLISRAIMVIGLDNVRSIALTALMLDKLSDRKKVARLRSEFVCSFFASILAREVAGRLPGTNAEEVSIAALFKNLGRLLVVSLDLALHEEVIAVAREANVTENVAAIQVIGMTYETLSAMVVRRWDMPESIAQAVEPAPAGVADAAQLSDKQQAQIVVSFSNDTAACIASSVGQQRERMLSQVLRRYGEPLKLERSTLNTLTETVGRDTINLTAGLGLGYVVEESEDASNADAVAGGEAASAAELPAELRMDAAPPDHATYRRDQPANATKANLSHLSSSAHPGEETPTTLEILLNYVQEIAVTMANGNVKSQEVLGLVLEALYRGMKFKRVIGCLRDSGRGLYRCRAALGADRADMLMRFELAFTYSADLFHAALAHGTDVHISDATEEKVLTRLPGWYRRLLPHARSFVLLPLVANKQTLGFIYADRDECDFNSYTKQELDLARTLRSQVLLALRGVK